MTFSFNFPHGLGDACNMAHVVKLYIDAGHDIEVEIDASKQPLFLAAGARITPHARQHHPYLHPPAPGRPEHHDHWSGNKAAYNVRHEVTPDVGGYAERWADLCAVKLDLDAQVRPGQRDFVRGYFDTLPRPIVLCHFQGNTSPESKNLPGEEQAKCVRGLLDQTDGSVVLLDWDNRVYRLNNYRVRHLADDWRGLDTLELYEAIKQADLVIGIDSGPLHLTRFTDTPQLGVWTHHHPSHFILPRRRTVNLVPNTYSETNRYRRIPYQIIEVGERQDGAAVADHAARLLSSSPHALMLDHFTSKARTFDASLSTFVDRHKSFGMLFRLAAERGLKRWVETGCIRSIDDWTAGFSTYVFGYYLREVGGTLDSVDLDETNVKFARLWTGVFGDTVRVHQSHSHRWIEADGAAVDVAYLDSAGTGTPGYHECCLTEAQLVAPKMRRDGLILIDDTCWSGGGFEGKGKLAVPWLISQGWRVVYGGYQVLLSR